MRHDIDDTWFSGSMVVTPTDQQEARSGRLANNRH